MAARRKKKAAEPTSPAPEKVTEKEMSPVARKLDMICTSQGRIHGQLVQALVLRRVSPSFILEQAALLESQAKELRALSDLLRGKP